VLAIDPASEDAAKVRPFIDEYQWENNVPVRIESVGLHTDFQTELIASLTQGTGAYDVVSMDDPWMPKIRRR